MIWISKKNTYSYGITQWKGFLLPLFCVIGVFLFSLIRFYDPLNESIGRASLTDFLLGVAKRGCYREYLYIAASRISLSSCWVRTMEFPFMLLEFAAFSTAVSICSLPNPSFPRDLIGRSANSFSKDADA